MNRTTVPQSDPTINRILAAAGATTGHGHATLQETASFTCNQTWDGGSRDLYTAVRLVDFSAVPVPGGTSPFHGMPPEVKMVPGIAVVEKSMYRGKTMPPTIHVHRENIAPLLPAPSVIPERIRKIVRIFSGIKSVGRPLELAIIQATTAELETAVELGLLKPQKGKSPRCIKAGQAESYSASGFEYDLAGCRVTIKGRQECRD